MSATDDPPSLTRRRLLTALAATGIGSAVFHRALTASALAAGNERVTPQMITGAAWVADIPLTDDEQAALARSVNNVLDDVRTLRKHPLANSDAPAVMFQPAPWRSNNQTPNERGTVALTETAAPQRPQMEDDLAFLPVTELAALLRTRQVSSVELTKLSLARLERYQPLLNCVVTLTKDLAIKQAERADRELSRGHYRGPLHGVPWGAKDLIGVAGYPTTWGAPQYREQQLPTATVARRLEQAGAVLVAKLSLGALAMGDRWFNGQTRNPWLPLQGSSGSSAGSASATAAGLVGFSLGSETMGSILSPSKRCGVTGLRPTFGRVSRAGCMTLSWSLDKIGPICRSVEDCALVLGAIHGADGDRDAAAVTEPFHWPMQRDLCSLRVGYVANEKQENELSPVLSQLQQLGVQLRPIQLPVDWPINELYFTLDVEAATVFDDLTRTNNLEGIGSWPRIFRRGQFVSAVEYLRAQRIRAKLQQAMREAIRDVDVYVSHNDLILTNLTGHPQICQPFGYREYKDLKLPGSVTFTGQLYGETELLALAHAFQQTTAQHLDRPDLHRWQKNIPATAEEKPADE